MALLFYAGAWEARVPTDRGLPDTLTSRLSQWARRVGDLQVGTFSGQATWPAAIAGRFAPVELGAR